MGINGGRFLELAAMERDVQRGTAGLDDSFAKHRKSSIEPHLVDYEAHLRNKGVSDWYLKEHFRRLRAILEHS